ncbi:aldehyde dehydrogenase family protein [Rubellicoccus peritrichatus]|uniref:Aldehyde dehydrogenase family protein n=1 Tax=Rubellicoccus peritrichatus TaxID=3080537 RepID=A0AAQ3L9E4_9BACT|nr:aldehyde dehydrogenase family protein [Puniceicoccus sp. CR14]WOO41795.1 aldehyde dehydrogenase family protein [Puniceicoccus sp. CR14]
MIYPKPEFKERYENFIGGEWTKPVDSQYFNNPSPVDGNVFCQVPRSNYKDVNLAVEAASQAVSIWSKTSATERCLLLNKIADRIETNLELLAVAETWENGKPIRESLHGDLPAVVDHFRYFGSVIRAESGEVADIDAQTVSMEVHEPLGVVGQIIPWNFPVLLAAWKLAPALAAGNCVVLKPAEQTPSTILMVMELIADLLPPGVVNVVNGFGSEAGKPLASHPKIKKVSFTGETTTGRLIMQYAAENIVPVTLELGGKAPNIFHRSVMDADDEFLDKAVEGFVSFAVNQGEVCTSPSRALIHESIYDDFMARCLERVAAIKMGDPLDLSTMSGAQVSSEQFEKIMRYMDIGREEGAEVLIGGDAFENPHYPNGYYVKPTVFKGHNKQRVFQEEIFGPTVSVTTFKDDAEGLQIANDTLYGLSAGVWTRDIHQMQTFARGIEAGRIWCNCYHVYPTHASFGGYKNSGFGRETHRMMLNSYRHTKNILTSYSQSPMGLF